MKIESNKNWTTCLRLNTGDGSPRVFLLNSHFLGSVPKTKKRGIISAIESLTGTTPRFHVILYNIRGKGSFDKR